MRFVKRARLLACAFAAALTTCLLLGTTPAVSAPLADPPPPATGTDFHPLTPTRVLNTRNGQGAGQVGKVGADSYISIDLSGQIPETAAPVTSVVLNVTVTDVTAPTYVTVLAGHFAGDPAPSTSNLNLVAGQTRANLVTVRTLSGEVDFYNHTGSVDIIADLEGYYSTSGGAEFTPVTPTRVLDSRLTGSFAPDATHQLSLAGHVPAGATAVALNVTGLDATASTYLTVWPHGGARPNASNLNLDPGQTVPNQVVVGLGTNATIDIYNHTGTADVLVDVAGYYTATAASSFSPVGSPRVLDTRQGLGATGPVGANQSITLDLSGIVPPTTSAVVLNVTGTDVTSATYVTVWPDGGTKPVASSLNLAPGETAANLVTVAVSQDGTVDLYNHVGSIDLIADLAGYFAPPTTPCSAGCVSGWGNDVNGSVGDRIGDQLTTTPTPLFGLTDVTSVAATHTDAVYGLRGDGTVWTWGNRQTGQAWPTPVAGVSGATAISAAASGGFFLKADGTVWSFGNVATITGNTATAPTQVAGLAGITAIASGADDLYALTVNGNVLSIGQDAYGQLGDGSTCGCRAGPVQVAGLNNITRISGGYLTGFAVRSDGTVWSWGYAAAGLASGTDSGPSSTPLRVNGLSDVTAIATGDSPFVDNETPGSDEFGYALRSDGTVWSWGYNVNGELGDGTVTSTPTWSFTPSQVVDLTGVTGIAAGANSGYALLADGTAWAWGSDSEGVLDDGHVDGQSATPVPMAGLAGATAIFGGDETAFALFPSR